MDKKFWQQRWQENRTGFHQPETNPWLKHYWPGLAPGSRVLVPLCGKSLDMIWLLEQGYRVTGVELSQIAVEQFFSENKLTATVTQVGQFSRWACDELELLCGDFLDLHPDPGNPFDAFFDRAALIALPANMRPAYTEHLKQLLPAGVTGLLITLGYNQLEMSGPPFAVHADEVRQLLENSFSIHELCTRDVLADNEKFREAGLTELSEAAWSLVRQ